MLSSEATPAPLAVRLAHHVPSLLRQPDGLHDADVVAFWTEGRRLFDRWQFILGSAVDVADQRGRLKPEAITTCLANATAVFATEPVARSWCAVLCEFDARRDRSWRPLVLRAFEMLLAARLDALRLMTHAQALPEAASSELDRLRRRSERRTDWLLASLCPEVDSRGFGFQPQRIADFSLDAVRIGLDAATASLALRPLVTDADGSADDLTATIAAAIDRFASR